MLSATILFQLIDGICQQLLNFYRSGETHLKMFTTQFIPSLAFLHLTDKSYSAVQTLLVSLYNLEVGIYRILYHR